MRSEPKIAIQGVSRSFGAVAALARVDIAIAPGEFVCIVGPSGCGKTTLLRILAGLETPSTGQVAITREDSARPLNTMIFQESSIFPWMTVRQNVGYGLRLRGIRAAEIAERIAPLLELTGLARFADAFPYQLSGGMKQRVSVARAFANDPELLLMDEPFAALDEQNKALLQEELLRLWSATRKTVVFITHSIDEALVLGDRVLVMSARPGRIKADIDVPFPRPRSVVELKQDPDYVRLNHDIWLLLRDEVRPAA